MADLVRALLIAMICALALAPRAAAQPTELDDSNFERLTQAASGQTAGRWLVALCSKAAPSPACARLAARADDVRAALLERGAWLAFVDTSPAGPGRLTAERFAALDAAAQPVFVLVPGAGAPPPAVYYRREGGFESDDDLVEWAARGGGADTRGTPRRVPGELPASRAGRVAAAVRAWLHEQLDAGNPVVFFLLFAPPLVAGLALAYFASRVAGGRDGARAARGRAANIRAKAD